MASSGGRQEGLVRDPGTRRTAPLGADTADAPAPAAPRARGGALEDLYRAYRGPLVAWLRQRFGPGPPDPEDIAQAAFAKLIASDGLGRADHVRSYLYAIAVNAARDEMQWIRRTDRFVERELRETGHGLEEITPERICSGRLDVDRMAELMEQLSAKQREIVQRSRILGQTYAQISGETGWSMADISRQLTGALTFLKSGLDSTRPDQASRNGRVPGSPRS